jgi:hypothetical protein
VGLDARSSAGDVYPAIVLTAVAMGLRNATVRHRAVPDLTTTVLTLTLTGLASDSTLAAALIPARSDGLGQWSPCWLAPR